jgi:predicted RND superfamily exporter protein
MMTTMAALMGTLPIAFGFGAGAESRRSLGISVVGGLMFSQLVTLFLTPVVYIYLEQAKNWSTRVFGKKRHELPAPAPGAEGRVGSGVIGAPMARVAEPRPDLGPGDRR